MPFETLEFEFYPGTPLLKTVKNGSNRIYTEITQYSPHGKIEFMNHTNNTVTNYIYDYATSRLSVLHAYNMSRDIIDKNYAYTKAGDIVRITDGRANITYTYAYDHLHRLISEHTSGTGAVAGTGVEIIELTYAEEAGTPVHAPVEASINGAATSYTYTETGNRMTKTQGLTDSTYESNADNMISKITVDGVEIRFFYDADNKRVKKTQGYASSVYFSEDFEIINNTDTLYIFAGSLRGGKTDRLRPGIFP